MICPGCETTVDGLRWSATCPHDGQNFKLAYCQGCGAVINTTHLEAAQASDAYLAEQAESSSMFYRTEESAERVAADIAEDSRAEFLVGVYPGCPRKTLADIGAGRGISAAAALRQFDEAIAVDLDLTNIGKAARFFPEPNRVTVTDSLEGRTNLSAISLFHVVEHMPFAAREFGRLKGRLAPGGAFLVQTPGYRPEYLCSVHYWFPTQESYSVLWRRLGLIPLGSWPEPVNGFVTSIAHMSGRARKRQPSSALQPA